MVVEAAAVVGVMAAALEVGAAAGAMAVSAAPMAPARVAVAVVVVAEGAAMVEAAAAVTDPPGYPEKGSHWSLFAFQPPVGGICMLLNPERQGSLSRRLRGRPASALSNTTFGSKRSNLAASPICHGITR